MNIAIASSGLGHVARGVETWALDSAIALSKLSSCQVAELLGESANAPYSLPLTTQQPNNPTTGRDSATTNQLNNPTTDLNVTLFSGAPLVHPVPCHVVALPCLKRGNPTTKQLSNCFPGFTWRWGFKDTYGWEQFTFWMLLWPKLRRGKFDILHVQDPMVANWCRLFRRWGLVKTKEILAHGTEESVEFLNKFDFVQHLAPWHLDQALMGLEKKYSVLPFILEKGRIRMGMKKENR